LVKSPLCLAWNNRAGLMTVMSPGRIFLTLRPVTSQSTSYCIVRTDRCGREGSSVSYDILGTTRVDTVVSRLWQA
jgi:hypothetical protein